MTSTEHQHQHHWTVASVHSISEGLIRYHRCDCGCWRITRTPAGPASYAEVASVPNRGSR